MKSKSIKIKYLAVLALIFLGLNVDAANIIVTNSNDSGTGSLRDAVINASDGDTISFDVSTNGVAITLNSEIFLNKSLSIIGNDSSNTIISGNDLTRIFNVTNAVALRGLKLTEGFINSSQSTTGAAIYVQHSGVVELEDCYVGDNSASFGAGIYVGGGGDLYISNSRFYGNESQGTHAHAGSAISLDDGFGSEIIVTNTTFENNSSYINDSNGRGGVVYVIGGQLNLSNCVFKNNESSSTQHSAKGGALYVVGYSVHVPNVSISKCEFMNNSVSANNPNGGSAEGGAIFVHTYSGGELSIDESEFIKNYCYADSGSVKGGAVCINSSLDSVLISNSLLDSNYVYVDHSFSSAYAGALNLSGTYSTIEHCSFLNNSATSPLYYSGGGALFATSGIDTLRMTNNTFYSNQAVGDQGTYGGAIMDQSRNGFIINNTIVNNSTVDVTDDGGGGMYMQSAFSNKTMYNNICANNISIGGPADIYVDGTGGLTKAGNLVLASGGVTFSYNSLPGLDASGPQYHGGFTPTIAITDINSNAINNGIDAWASPVDQRFMERVGNTDIGAFEYSAVCQTPIVNAISVNSCFDSSSGTIDLIVAGGMPRYNFQWSSGHTSRFLTGLTDGTYNYTVTEGNGCSVSGVVTVQENTQMIVTTTVTDIYCYGSSSGEGNVEATGGPSTNYTYLWSNNETTSSISGLAPGVYDVTVSSGTCSEIGQVAPVQVVGPITATLVEHSVSCNGNSDGYVEINTAGGSGSYYYDYLIEQPFNWTSAQNIEEINNLYAGEYWVDVFDSACFVNSFGSGTMLNYTITEPGAFYVATDYQKNVNCFGGSDGEIGVQSYGGVTPYHYLWNNGEATDTIIELNAGAYTVTATESNGCGVYVHAFTVTEPSQLSITVATTNVICNGESNGTAILTATGGSSDYTYDFGGFDETALVAGDYLSTVTDANGCAETISYIITEPQALSVTANTIETETCADSLNTLYGAGATTYTWDNGITDNVAFNVLEGVTIYNVTGTDAVGCKDYSSITITGFAYLAGDSDCSGGVDGSEISGDTSGDGVISSPETTGDIDGNGLIDGSETSGDVDGNGVIDGSELSGDANGNGLIDIPEEIAGDTDGDGIITSPEISGDINGNGVIDGTELLGDANGNGTIDNVENVGIEDLSKHLFSVYPNPTTGSLNIQLSTSFANVEVSVKNALGKEISNIKNKNTSFLNVDLGASKGIYFIEVKADNNTQVFRVINQ